MKNRLFLAVLIAAAAVTGSCRKDSGSVKRGDYEIISFTVEGVAWNVSGSGITHVYPKGTAPGSLTPVIVVSEGASVSPASGAAQNFFTDAGVVYTVTAEDGATKKSYTAKATAAAAQ
jgi:hypothetical protein